MKKSIAILLAALMLLTFGLTGCGTATDSDLKYVQDKGTMVVGITDFEPLDFKGADGNWTGFDAELAKLVGEKLGVKVEFQLIEWTKKEAELAGKTIDCIWNGLTWSEERAENMGMTDYYMTNKQVVVTKAENAEKYATLDSINVAGVKAAAEGGSAGQDFITANFKNASFIEKQGQIDVLTELVSGTSDIGVIDFVMANYLINKEGSQFAGLKIVDGVAPAEAEYYAIALRKDSDMVAKFNEILKGLKEDGTVEKLAKEYGLVDALVK